MMRTVCVAVGLATASVNAFLPPVLHAPTRHVSVATATSDEPQVIVDQMRSEMADFLEVRSLLVDVLTFIERKSPEPEVRNAAEVLGARLKNLRFGE